MTDLCQRQAESRLREIHSRFGRVYLYRIYGGWKAGLQQAPSSGIMNGYCCPKQPTAAHAVHYLWRWLWHGQCTCGPNEACGYCLNS